MQIRFRMAIGSDGIEFSAGEQVEASAVLLDEEVEHHAGPVLHRGVPLSVADSLRVQVEDLDVLLGVSEPTVGVEPWHLPLSLHLHLPRHHGRSVQRCEHSAGECMYVAESGHLEAGGVAGAVDEDHRGEESQHALEGRSLGQVGAVVQHEHVAQLGDQGADVDLLQDLLEDVGGAVGQQTAVHETHSDSPR